MHRTGHTERTPAEDGSVRVVSPRPAPGRSGEASLRPPLRWLRYALPAAAAGLLLALVLTDTGTLTTEPDEIAPPTVPLTPERVLVSGVTVPEDVAMAWSAMPILDTRIVGITAEGALAAVVGTTSTLIVPDSLQGPAVPEVDAAGPGASSPFLFAALLETQDGTLIVGHDPAADRANLWRPASPEGPSPTYLPEPQRGLDDVAAVTGAASNGRSLLIVGEHPTGLPRVWITRSGNVWEEHAPRGLANPRPRVVAAVGGTYLLGGARCRPECVPAIWTSSDGIAWVPGAGVGGEVPGVVTGITATGSALYAVGTMGDGSGASWVSRDRGVTWEQESTVGFEERVVLTLEAINVRSGATPTARLRVDGEVVEVVEGGSIATPLGDVAVPALGSMALFLVDGDAHAVRIGEAWSLRTRFRIEDVDAADGTIVAVGSRQRPNRIGRPTVWVRDEGSSVWNASPLPGGPTPRHVLAAEAGILAAGSFDSAAGTGGESAVWGVTFSHPEEEASALEAVRSLLAAFETGESFPAAEALHRRLEAPLEVPGFAGLPFRLPDTGDTFDPDPLVNAVRYTASLDVSITLEDCTARVVLTDADLVRVACGYAASSTLLRLLGLDESRGRLSASVRDGRVTAMELDAPEELAAWQRFETHAAGTYDGAAFSAFVTGRPSEATAGAHLDAAEDLGAAPGR